MYSRVSTSKSKRASWFRSWGPRDRANRLLNILGILDDYDTGEYFLNGRLIKHLSETQAAAARNNMIGYIFQSFNLINYKNAVENVALPLYYQAFHAASAMPKPSNTSTGWDSATGPTTCPTRCRAARSSAWPSPGH